MRENNFVYHLGVTVFKLIFRIIFRGSVKGSLPRGGVIVCANHLSNLDPPILGSLSSKPLHFMAKKELFENPLFGWLNRALNAFPMSRDFFDRKAFRYAINLAESGRNVGIFPEGTRNKSGTDEIGPIKRGATYLLYHTTVPVIPVIISGSNYWKKLKRIKITIGEAIDLPERKLPYTRETAESICRKIKNALEKTRDSSNGDGSYCCNRNRPH